MILSDGLIYFGIICLICGIYIIVNDTRSEKRVNGNKKLRERIEFYKNKWQSEHAGQIIAPMVIVGALIIASMITDMPLFIYISGIVLVAAYVILYNKMMIYVEANAFNGKGIEMEEE